MTTNRRPEDRWWIPVAVAADVAHGAPLAATRCGEPVVLWRDGEGALRAFTDRCPHRGARLSLGRVDAGVLECPYHGWRFAGDGQCVAIPATPSFAPPATHRAQAWALHEAFGLAWLAAAGNAEAFDPGGWSEGAPARQTLCGPYEVATSAPRVVENFLDTAHFGIVHEGWLGERGHLDVPAHEVVADARGRPGVPHYRAWQPRASSAADSGAWVDYRYRLLSPYAALLVKQAEGALPAEAYALWTCPTADDTCRVWFTIFTADAARPDAELAAFQDRIFAQDRPVLESQRPKALPLSGGEVHSAADRLAAAYRRFLQREGITFGTC